MDAWKDDIEKYISGKSTPAERHALEKKALSDPFLADALEGAQEIPRFFDADVSDLNQKINGAGKNRWLWPLRIAASVAGIALVSVIVIFSTIEPGENLASKSQAKPPSRETAANDSLHQVAAEGGDSAASVAKPSHADAKKSDNLIAAAKPEQPKRKVAEEAKADASTSAAIVTLAPPSAGAGGTLANKSTTSNSASGPVLRTDTISATGLATVTAPTVVILKDEEQAADDVARPTAEPKAARAESRKRASSFSPTNFEVSGVVRDQSGQPIPGVNILAQGTSIGTITDIDGKYSIAVPQPDQVLVYSFVGYISQQQPADKAKTGDLDVQLQEDATQLSEVVVTGYADRSAARNDEPVVRLAEPVGGRKAYDQYLEDSRVYPQQALDNQVEGKVTIEFTVGVTGTLSDFSVVKKLGFGCEEEVIRLVREGPQWRPSYIDNEAVESLVRVKTRFALPGKK